MGGRLFNAGIRMIRITVWIRFSLVCLKILCLLLVLRIRCIVPYFVAWIKVQIMAVCASSWPLAWFLASEDDLQFSKRNRNHTWRISFPWPGTFVKLQKSPLLGIKNPRLSDGLNGACWNMISKQNEAFVFCYVYNILAQCAAQNIQIKLELDAVR